MGQISLNLPQVGGTNAAQEPLIPGDFSTIQTVINGNLDSTNLAATAAQSASVNQSGQTVKGAVNIATSQNTGSTTYTTLSTPDQVTGVVLPSNGLLAVWYQATWQESVAHAARAAIFIGANQLKVVDAATADSPAVTQAASTGISSDAGKNQPLFSTPGGLASQGGLDPVSGYAGDVTTGQVVGAMGGNFAVELNGTIRTGSSNNFGVTMGGPCYVFAAAGTYNVAVQFKASSGTVTALNRKLWVQAISFA